MGDNRICCRDAQRPSLRVVLVVVVLVAGAAAALAQPRAPLPDAPAQARAQELLRDVYGEEYDAAKTSEQKTELARKLLDQAAKSPADPANHFVLLRVAKEVAILAADCETALDAVERIVATYDVDAMEARLECVQGLADAAKLSSQRAALAVHACSLVDVALAEDDFEAAGRFGQIAEDLAKRGRDYSLAKEVIARMEKLDEIRQAHAEYQKAQARLDESPTDAEANLAAGRYLCLSRGDWDRGIPMLALGGDPALKVPAVKELVGADSPDAQVALGDAWWDVAQSREGRERDGFLLRAGYWYEQAQSKVASGLAKVKLDQRLAEIANVESPATEVARDRPRSGTSGRRAKRGRTFDPASATLLGTLRGHSGGVAGLAFGAEEWLLASGGADSKVIFWDLRSGQKRGELRDHEGRVLCVAFSRDGSLFASSGEDPTIKVGVRPPRAILAGHTGGVHTIAFSPDGSILASASDDGTVKLWDLARQEVLHTFPCTNRCWSPAFSPDGSLVGTANEERETVLWDVASGKPRRTFPGDGGSHVGGLAFTPDGSTLATCSYDGTIRLWDVATGNVRNTLKAHRGEIRSIAFAGDGATLASGGWKDGSLKLWDVASGELRATLAGNKRGVFRVAFSPDGSLLASTGEDGVVRLWGADPSGKLPKTAPPGETGGPTSHPTLPDLRVAQVFLENGDKSAWIRNDGGATAADVAVQFVVDGAPADTSRVDVPPEEQVQATVSKLPPGRHVVGVVVDPENRISESNEANNVLEAALTAILTRDGRPVTAGRMPMPKGKVSTPGLTPDRDGWISLLPLVQANRDARDAQWKRDGQTAAFSADRQRAQVSLPLAVAGSYELQARVNVTKAKDATAICLPIVGDRAVVLEMKGDRGNTESPTVTIRLRGVNPEPQAQANASMDVGTEYAFSCRVAVSPAGVGVEILRDDQMLFQWVGQVSQVAEGRMMRPGTVELRTAYYSSSEFSDLRLRMLAGQATALFSE
ncbi:MAG TPA: CARDB domain-containing protein [Thermoguttaceae bacterium]|nr:CARDB domain-containing protein [Thermoguttaceae bacterium]